MPDIVYVLTNPAMPGIVKIGRTTQDVQARMQQLWETGVPLPFECVVAIEIDDVTTSQKLEAGLFEAFRPQRVHPKREFFAIETSQLRAILELFKARDVSPQVQKEAEDEMDPTDREAVWSFKRTRSPNFNFEDMGILIGSTLHSVNSDEEAIVESSKKVSFRGEEMSLTQATRLAAELAYSVPPCPRWTFDGRNLGSIYRETYGDREPVSEETDD